MLENSLLPDDWDILLNTDIDGFTSVIGDRLVAGAVHIEWCVVHGVRVNAGIWFLIVCAVEWNALPRYNHYNVASTFGTMMK